MSVSKLECLNADVQHSFFIPVKKINEGQDVSHFLVSKAYGDIMTFLLQLNRAMSPSALCPLAPSPESPVIVSNLQKLLEDLDRSLEEVPPNPGPRRFGNVSFRKWYQLLKGRAPAYMQEHLPSNLFSHPGASDPAASQEMMAYFLGSFGSAQRLDYGTGHELSFLAFLGCIWKLGGFDSASSDGDIERSIVLELIDPYLHLIRRLIKTYTLEPAGSHGVWGLDDHSFLPYIFGSAQYSPSISESGNFPLEGSHPNAPDPSDIIKPQVVSRERSQNLYFGAIGFINDVKKGPFWEHSPMLFDISGVKAGWAKINKGMLKMYNAEVLSKFPVVQHFYFGSLFSWDRDPNALKPTTSVHANAQPLAERKGNPPVQSSTRMPAGGTAAPWASKGVGMADPMTETAAPWVPGSAHAIPPTVKNVREAPSGRPPAFLKDDIPNGAHAPNETTIQAPTKLSRVKPG